MFGEEELAVKLQSTSSSNPVFYKRDKERFH